MELSDYALGAELDATSAKRPIARFRYEDRPTPLLEAPDGGRPWLPFKTRRRPRRSREAGLHGELLRHGQILTGARVSPRSSKKG